MSLATSPAPTAVMIAAADGSSPSTQGREVVRYEPHSQRETRSQQSRLAKAAEGNLQARLELISLEAAERGLARRFCKHQPDRSILDYLRAPDDGVTAYEAASTVLEDLADQTEATALESALAFRYVQAHELWKGHPNPAVRSAEDLVRHLDGGDYVQASIIIGTSAQAAKRSNIRLIDDCWGSGWFEKIPHHIRDPSWRGPEELSKRMLTQIAANAKQDLGLEAAVERWTEAIQQRNDFGARRRTGTRGKVTPHLLLADVASLNKAPQRSGKVGRTSDIFFPDEAKEDRLRVELIPRRPLSKPTAPPPEYTETALSKSSKKRKRMSDVVGEENGYAPANDDGWVESADGRWLVKRMRNQIVRKPVEEVVETDDSPSSSPDDENQDASTEVRTEAAAGIPSSALPYVSPVRQMNKRLYPQDTAHPKACAGSTFATVLRKLTDEFSELEDSDYVASRFCDSCRAAVTSAVHSVLHDIRMNAEKLDAIDLHSFGETTVPARLEYSESPKRPRRRNTWIVAEDSDTD
ncbi:MAG: hypothetical protein L6R36_008246 [Xanthoria steineri]|nr:MAG: hypothetical protein L6R36_008246 [Xanthoria steineri]